LVVVAACAASAYVLSVRGQTGVGGHSGTLYDRSRWFLLALLVVAGIGLLVRRHIVMTQVAATLGGISAAQLMTTGIVAAKHWRPLSGMAGYGDANLSTVVLLAWVLTVAAGVATVACLAAVRASGVRRDGVPYRYRWIGLVAGVILAVGLPPILGSGDAYAMGLRHLTAYALLYSLPWGVAIAASGWLNRVGATTALTTVAVCAAAAVGSHYVLWVEHPARGFLPTVALAVILAVGTSIQSGKRLEAAEG
jgi:hypothetical protein